MKKLFLLLTAVLCTIGAYANGTVTLDNGLVVNCYDETWFGSDVAYCDLSNCEGDVYIPATVECDGKTYQVKYIGEPESWREPLNNTAITSISGCENIIEVQSWVLQGASSLVSVEIPNITYISGECFEGCESLQTVIMPKLESLDELGLPGSLVYVDFSSVRNIPGWKFYGYSNIETVIIPNAECIGEYAFWTCPNLTTVNMLNVERIGDGAFEGCESLVSVDCPNLKSVGGRAFSGCENVETVDIPNVEILADDVFRGCKSLVSIDLAYVQTIESSCFEGCENLTTVNIPNVESLGTSAFNACKSLVSVNFPKLQSVDGYSFYGCENLATVNMPNIESLGGGAFNRCKSLVSVDFPKLLSVGDYSFYGCENLATVNMPNVGSIGDYAFYDCKSLDSVDFPNLKNLGGDGFYGCDNLSTVNIPSVEVIGREAFRYCKSLASISLPNVKEIGYNAFRDTSTLIEIDSDTPCTIDSNPFSMFNMIFVPDNAVALYRAEWDVCKTQILGASQDIDYEINVTANDAGSDVRTKLLAAGANSDLYSVVSLKLDGTINGYDIMMIRNKMPNLHYLDMSDVRIVDCDYEYYEGCHTENDILGDNSFRGMSNLVNIVLPNSIKRIGSCAFQECGNLSNVKFGESLEVIGSYAFCRCQSLQSITLPENLIEIEPNAFFFCKSLKTVNFSPKLRNIGGYSFYYCSCLTSVILPPSVQRIGSYAFYNCYNIETLRIPESIERIDEQAFISSNFVDIYSWSAFPTDIAQDTFNSASYSSALVHVPLMSEDLYYWDTKWSQFQNLTTFDEPYEYFYVPDGQDFQMTARAKGDNLRVEIKGNGGIIVEGEEPQNIEETVITEGGSLIGENSSLTESGANLNIGHLKVEINICGGRWYFFSFPFDLPQANIEFTGDYVWRYYDGEERALNGSGAWKNFTGAFKSGSGYIFQADRDGKLTVTIDKVAIGDDDMSVPMHAYESTYAQDANWNLIGNPFTSYYYLSDIDTETPVTVWDGSTYRAYSPQDDDFLMHPFQAFFVQKPDQEAEMHFPAEKRLTYKQSTNPNNANAAKMRRAARRSDNCRALVDLELTDGTVTDNTRVVYNDLSTVDYELNRDVAKFMSVTAPQIYTVDSRNVRYSINERPLLDGTVRLGISVQHSGVYTISALRNDCSVVIKDLATGESVNLTDDDFTVTLEAGTYEDRFVLIQPDALSVSTIERDDQGRVQYIGIDGIMYGDGTSVRPNGVVIEKSADGVHKVIK